MHDPTSIKNQIESLRKDFSWSDVLGFTALIIGLVLSSTSVKTVKITPIETAQSEQSKDADLNKKIGVQEKLKPHSENQKTKIVKNLKKYKD